MDQLFRYCPRCNSVISYSSKQSYYNGVKNNTECKVCASLQCRDSSVISYDQDGHEIYKRECPKCKKDLFYKTYHNLQQAYKHNSLCHRCVQYKIDPNSPYIRNCPNCDILLTYKNRNNLLTSIREKSLCKDCTYLQKNCIDLETKTKLCKGCKEILPFAEFHFSVNNSIGCKPLCKKCNTAKACKYQKDNMARIIEQHQEYYKKNINKIRENEKLRRKSLKSRYKAYSSGAKARNIDFNLTIEQFESFWQKPCTYCSSEIETVGIDRIDSKIGYQLNNCISCCHICNYMKREYDIDFFLEHILKISNRHKDIYTISFAVRNNQ